MTKGSNIKVGEAAGQGVTAALLVATPAFGGQVVSGLIQGASTEIAAFAADDVGQAVVDLAGGAIVAGVEVAAAGAIGGKSLAKAVAPLAIAGAVTCAVLPWLDKKSKELVTSLTTKKELAAPASGGRVLPMRTAGGLIAENNRYGGIVPGGIEVASGQRSVPDRGGVLR